VRFPPAYWLEGPPGCAPVLGPASASAMMRSSSACTRSSTAHSGATSGATSRTIGISRPITMSRPYQPACPRPRCARRSGSGHDQQASLVIHVGAGGLQASLADPKVVTAQQQVNRVRAAGGRRHQYGDHRPCRAAACPRSYVQRYSSLQLRSELLARGGRPVRPPPLHTLTITPAWTGRQGPCSCEAWSWVPPQLTLPGSRVVGLWAAIAPAER
jgi:hypothetical protein